MAQLLGSLLGAAGLGGPASGLAPSITVTLPGVPGFFQSMSDLAPVSSDKMTGNLNETFLNLNIKTVCTSQ